MKLTSTRRVHLDADRETVWAAMNQVEEFPRWWPWLRHFDGMKLATGSAWECEVQPPLPYALRFTVLLDEVVPACSVKATLSGDLTGTARLELQEAEAGCQVRFNSALAPQHGVLRLVAAVAPPLARFGHDWVLDTGTRQFADRLARGLRQPSGRSPS